MKPTLDPEKFYNYCGEVREKFYAIAPWVIMWPALHKVSIVVGLLIYFSRPVCKELDNCGFNIMQLTVYLVLVIFGLHFNSAKRKLTRNYTTLLTFFSKKVIDHYHVLLENLPPTIVAAMLTEESIEGGNKHLKKIEKFHARPMTPELALKDTFHRLMRRSDPIIQASISYPINLWGWRFFFESSHFLYVQDTLQLTQ